MKWRWILMNFENRTPFTTALAKVQQFGRHSSRKKTNVYVLNITYLRAWINCLPRTNNRKQIFVAVKKKKNFVLITNVVVSYVFGLRFQTYIGIYHIQGYRFNTFTARYFRLIFIFIYIYIYCTRLITFKIRDENDILDFCQDTGTLFIKIWDNPL